MAPVEPESSKLLYNSTLTVYRLSPLHFSGSRPLLSPANLLIHARRLGDALKGDVLRGVRVALDDHDDGLTRSGPLKACYWTLLSGERAEDSDSGLRGPDGFGFMEGIYVETEYETNSYHAWILRSKDSAAHQGDGEATHLPLLCVRMPNALKEMFLTYLGSAFDARVDTLHISSLEIAKTVETYFEACKRNSAQALFRIIKDVQLSFTFKAPIFPNLRSLDITISRDDLTRMIKEGERVEATSTTYGEDGPFFTAITKHLESHLAVDLTNQEVLLGRVACGAFALGKEGKIKIFTPYFDSGDERIAAASKEATGTLFRSLLALASAPVNGLPQT